MRSVACVMAVLLVTAPLVAADDPAMAFAALKAEWSRQEREYAKALDASRTAAERDAVNAKAPKEADFAERFLKLAAAHPGTKAELSSLCWAALNASGSEPGRQAIVTLTGGRIERATPTELLASLDATRTQSTQDCRPLAAAMLACAKRSPDDPKAAKLLASVCVAYLGDKSAAPPVPFAEAADLIVARFADSKDVSHFAELLFVRGVPPWGGKYEKHLRALVDKNQTPLVGATSRYALAAVVRGVERQAEAERLFRQFVADYDGKTEDSGVRERLLADARRDLARIERCGLGKPAQEIAGDGLDGKPLKLSDHRGQVVLLVFWASWCGPCLADVPHEKELVERFKGRPFVLIGVNGDDDLDEAKKAVAKAGIPWRSLRGGGKGRRESVAEAWAVAGWPTVYVIDHEGVIRHDNLRGKRLDEPLEALVKKAEAAKGRGPQ